MSGEHESFDYLVIGGGSAGLSGARRAQFHGARVALIEPNPIGGTCVNRGCVPKKILWYAAELANHLSDCPDYGFDVQRSIPFDYQKLQKASNAYVAGLRELHASHLRQAGIEIVAERATLAGQGLVETDSGRKLRAPHVLLASGTRPRVPAFDGAQLGITSDDWFQLSELPKRLLVVGGGYVGVEIAGIAQALGSEVTFAYRGDLPLPGFDAMLRECLLEQMRRSGLVLLEGFETQRVTRSTGGTMTVESDDGRQVANLDAVLWAIGRTSDARTWVKAKGLAFDPWGFVCVDEFQCTNLPGLYAVGDVTGKACLTPVAVAAASRLSDRLFGGKPEAKLDYDDIPTVVFSHPPIGTVGLSEAQAFHRYGDRIRCYVKRFANLYSSVTQHEQVTAMKLVTLLPDERIVGIHAFGLGTDELMQGFAVALRMGARKADFDRTVAIHPTAAEEFVTLR
jgi:glutathione reductase (NADPH)